MFTSLGGFVFIASVSQSRSSTVVVSVAGGSDVDVGGTRGPGVVVSIVGGSDVGGLGRGDNGDSDCTSGDDDSDLTSADSNVGVGDSACRQCLSLAMKVLADADIVWLTVKNAGSSEVEAGRTSILYPLICVVQGTSSAVASRATLS